MDDLIKREDALAAINAFERDFEQSWKVQFSADIKALPAIEELVKERDDLQVQKERDEALAKLTKAMEALRETTQMLSRCTFIIIRIKGQYFSRQEVVDKANAVLAKLEKTK